MIAAFGDFQVGIVPRRQLDTLGRHQIRERVVLAGGRHKLVYRTDHFFIRMGPRYRQHAGMGFADFVCFNAHTTGDNDFTVFTDSFTNGVQRFLFRRINKTAGVHHHNVGVFVGWYYVIPVQPQLGQNTLGVYQGLGATQTDKTNSAVTGFCVFGLFYHRAVRSS